MRHLFVVTSTALLLLCAGASGASAQDSAPATGVGMEPGRGGGEDGELAAPEIPGTHRHSPLLQMETALVSGVKPDARVSPTYL